LTDAGLTVTEESTAGFTVTGAVKEAVPYVAVTVTGVAVSTPMVVAVSVPVVAPAAMTSLPVPTESADELLDRFTVKPPVGAGEPIPALITTVWPPYTVAGAVTLVRAAGSTFKLTDLLTDPSVAVIVIDVVAATTAGVKLYEPLTAPAGIVMVVPAGMVVPSELESEITAPLGLRSERHLQ